MPQMNKTEIDSQTECTDCGYQGVREGCIGSKGLIDANYYI